MKPQIQRRAQRRFVTNSFVTNSVVATYILALVLTFGHAFNQLVPECVVGFDDRNRMAINPTCEADVATGSLLMSAVWPLYWSVVLWR